MLELIFHCRMLEYLCLASDPQSADANYLPYYADIDALRYLYGLDYNSSFEQGLNLFDFFTRDDPVSWRSIRNECENNTKANNVTSNNNLGRFGSEGAGCTKLCDIVDCFYEICEHDPIRFMRPMLQASFCLQPPSDTPTRRSTFDSIMVGCIPVFFEDSSAKAQYGWHLPEDQYREFSVFILNEDVVFKETRVLDVFRSIPKVRVRMMREKVL
ncbi:hypothetical protein C1H46_001636 [Malus baccata]|uniref:Exostosin GT47 domain-containing protein n=1 Tax=Malus baccata TaxID=106549 RepID=A0A540NQ80_MALBA|nr:hypothetical protein C1H46_001636 [Malus baccata]